MEHARKQQMAKELMDRMDLTPEYIQSGLDETIDAYKKDISNYMMKLQEVGIDRIKFAMCLRMLDMKGHSTINDTDSQKVMEKMALIKKDIEYNITHAELTIRWFGLFKELVLVPKEEEYKMIQRKLKICRDCMIQNFINIEDVMRELIQYDNYYTEGEYVKYVDKLKNEIKFWEDFIHPVD